MKMGTAQKQNISVQHRMWNRYDSRPKQAIPEFSEWFLNGIRTFEAKGAEFELLQGMVKISWPGKVPMLRTVEDFRREYESCYLSHGKNCENKRLSKTMRMRILTFVQKSIKTVTQVTF